MSHVAVYCRRSSDPDGKAISVAVQERHGRGYANEHWPELRAEAYVDNDLSAADPNVMRPAYQRMLDGIRSGTIAHVVAREQARLTRQPSEWEDLCVALTRAGIDVVHTTTGGTVSVAKGSRLSGRIMAVVDAEEAERASVRVRVAMSALAEEGRPSGSTAYGYQRVLDEHGRKALVPDPATAAVVRRIVERIAAGASLGVVAAELTADGVPTSRGAKVWHRESIRVIATSPRIVGDRVHQGRVVGPAAWDPIVDRGLWQLAQARLAGASVVAINGQVRSVNRTSGTPRRYLLTGGLASCAECGSPLIAQLQDRRRGVRVPAYSCPHPSRPDGGCGRVHVTGEHLEREVVDRLRALVDAGRMVAPQAPDRAPWAAQFAEAEARLSMLAEALGRDDLTDIEWRSARAPALARRDEAARHLAAAPVEMDLAAEVNRWDELVLVQRRDVLSYATEWIRVAARGRTGPRWDPSRVKVRWRL